MGVQVTDVIKMFISEGLHGDIRSNSPVVKKIKDYEDEIAFLKGKLYVLENLLHDLLSRVDELESPDFLLRGRRYSSGRINKS